MRVPRSIGTAALVTVVAALTACAAPPAATRTGATRAMANASCPPAAVAPFSCDAYLVSGSDSTRDTGFLQHQNAEAWFEQSDSTPRLVLEVGNRFIHVPVTISGSAAVISSTPDDRFATARCRSDDSCRYRAWLASFFANPVAVTLDGTNLPLAHGAQHVTGIPTKRLPARPDLRARTVAGRTLLTYRPSADGLTMAAFNGGNLSTNEAGCLTDGRDVLVLADTTRLHADGSIDIDGRHIEQGEPLDIGGGEVGSADDTTCGTDLDYWYY